MLSWWLYRTSIQDGDSVKAGRSLVREVNDLPFQPARYSGVPGSTSPPLDTGMVAWKVALQDYPLAPEALNKRIPKLIFSDTIATQVSQTLKALILQKWIHDGEP